MTSQVAWLNFDVEQQRQTQLVMAALAEQSTVDELGLGMIRDLIAGVLHPNMTVLLTRARYLVFLPRIYQHLPGTTTESILTEGRRAETRLTSSLVEHYHGASGDSTGIIGRRRMENTKQLASGIYWGLLHTLGILKVGGSVVDYAKYLAEANGSSRVRALLHSDDDAPELVQGAWLELPKDEGGAVSFALSGDEAGWLRQRFRDVENYRPDDEKSLIAWLLDPGLTEWVVDADFAWEHPAAATFPAATATAMHLGRDLDRLVHGARILYNWLCAQGVPPGCRRDELVGRYEQAMAVWLIEIDVDGLPSRARLNELDAWAKYRFDTVGASQRARMRWRTTAGFLSQWHHILDMHGDPLTSTDAASLITNREATLKPGRARLTDPALLTDWQGNSGYGRFDYNWSTAHRVLTDIHSGLGTPFVEMGATR